MYTNETKQKLSTEEARQGERKPGMPSVLAISTITVSVVFAIMLAVVLT